LGTLGLIFAFRTGEFEIFGVIGLILLAIGLWGTGVINFSVLGIILLLLGVFLLAAEFFGNPGFGFLGVSGVISLLLGILNFGAEPLLAPSIFDFATLFTIGVLISLLIFIIITSRGVITTFRTKPTFGPESLLGEKGKVIETISPFGRVNVNKESWSARSEDDERIEKNSIVVVTKVVGNTLIVSKNKK
jgi:membrane-bound serine protease (ClpP class)